jgi:hypothetical protein
VTWKQLASRAKMNEWNGLKTGTCISYAMMKIRTCSQLLRMLTPTAPGFELDLHCCGGWEMHTYTHMHVDSIGLVHPRHNSSLDIGRTVPAVGWTPREGVQLCNYNITEKT